MKRAGLIGPGVVLGSALLLLVQVVLVARGWDFYQYDFRAYYLGASLFADGADPYDFPALQEMARGLGLGANDHPFIYPPYMLWAFLPLALLSFKGAYFTWLGLQLVALGALFRLGSRQLGARPAWLAPLLALGLNGAVAAVLRSGQLTLMLLALALSALALLAAGRPAVATALLALVALPKLWLLPLLGLLLERLSVARIALMLLGLLVFAGVIALGARLYPDYQAVFAAGMGQLTEGARVSGPQNGSALNFMRSAAALSGATPVLANILWAGFAALIAAIAGLRFFQATARADTDPGYLFALVTLSLCLVAPRVMVYQWVIALPGLALVLSRMPARFVAGLLFAAALVPTLYIGRYGLGREIHEVLDSAPLLPLAFSNLFVVLITWGLLLRRAPAHSPYHIPARGRAHQTTETE